MYTEKNLTNDFQVIEDDNTEMVNRSELQTLIPANGEDETDHSIDEDEEYITAERTPSLQ